MSTATGHQSVADLAIELHQRQRQQYARLQRVALTQAYQRRTGLVPDSFVTVESYFAVSTFGAGLTVDPTRHLDAATIARVLATATGSTATG